MRCLHCNIFLFAAVFLSLHRVSSAQEQVILKKAEQFQGAVVGGKNVTIVVGSVHYYVPGKGLNIFCDTTYVYREDELYILKGNVRLIKDEKSLLSELIRYDAVTGEAHSPGPFTYFEAGEGRSLKADHGTYFYGSDVLKAEDNVVFTDSLHTVYADTLDYFDEGKRITASGNIRFFDHEQNAAGLAQYGKYIEEGKYGMITGDPRIAIADSAGSDSLYIYGRVMEYFGGEGTKYIVSDSVTLQKGALAAYCQQATYDAGASMVYLRVDPMIEQESTEIFGNEIDLVILNGNVIEVLVRDSAVAFTDADTTGQYELKNELRGKTIDMYLDGESIYKIVATHNAESIYYRFDPDQQEELIGKNVSSSGQIVIFLKDGYLSEIKSVNGIVGKFIPKSRLPDVKKKRSHER